MHPGTKPATFSNTRNYRVVILEAIQRAKNVVNPIKIWKIAQRYAQRIRIM
eukprot:UN07203